MGKSQRSKGQRGENEVAAILTDWLGEAVKRRLGQERDSGADIHVGQYAIQVKRTERLRLWEAMEQAKRDAPPGMVPALVARRNGGRWLLVLELEPHGLDAIRETLVCHTVKVP